MDVRQHIQGVLDRLEIGVQESRAELATHASELAASLALVAASGEPGYDRAVRHARGQLLAHGALEVVEGADALDDEKREALVGAIVFAAEILA